jgi:hypothetical protein
VEVWRIYPLFLNKILDGNDCFLHLHYHTLFLITQTKILFHTLISLYFLCTWRVFNSDRLTLRSHVRYMLSLYHTFLALLDSGPFFSLLGRSKPYRQVIIVLKCFPIRLCFFFFKSGQITSYTRLISYVPCTITT